MKVAAKTQVRISSTEADVLLSAPSKHLLASAAGAYIRIEGDNIELGAPGRIEFRGSQREWVGAKSAGPESLKFGESDVKPCGFTTQQADNDGAALVPLA